MSHAMLPKIRATLAIIAAIVCSAFILSGCSDDETLFDGSDKPCGIEPGLYANIAGTAEPVVMCVPDNRIEGTVDTGVHAQYSPQSRRYLISAVYRSNAVTHELDLSFPAHAEIPAVLTATADETRAQTDSSFVWVFYRVTDQDGSTWSTASASGTMSLTFNSPEIVVATFSAIELRLGEDSLQPPSIIRVISEGYINLTIDSF